MPGKEPILTPKAPKPIGPYSQAIKAGGFLFCSGQIALNPETGEFSAADVEGQTHQVLKNLSAVLEAGGSSPQKIIKTVIFLKSMADFPKVNAIYEDYLKGTVPPARSTVEASKLPKDALVEIEAIAML